MTDVRFYLDENIDPEVANQLRRRQIDAVSIYELRLAGETDENHLAEATRLERVLCTHDTDFHTLAQETLEHTGIVWSPHERATIGGWLRELLKLYAQETAESMFAQVRFVNAK